MKEIFVIIFTVFLTKTFQVQFINKQDHTYDLKLAPRLFKEFMKEYKRNYTGERKEYKYNVFVDNLVRINAINQNLPGRWYAVIGPFTDLTYMEFIRINKLTKADFTNVGSSFRNVINCTDRRGYLFERFSDKVKNDYDSKNNGSASYEEYSSENDTAIHGADEYYDSDEDHTKPDDGNQASDTRTDDENETGDTKTGDENKTSDTKTDDGNQISDTKSDHDLT